VVKTEQSTYTNEGAQVAIPRRPVSGDGPGRVGGQRVLRESHPLNSSQCGKKLAMGKNGKQ